MSTKCTILDTPGEHWYEDEVYQQYEEGGEGRCFVLEFDECHKFEPGPDYDPVEFPEGMIITIREGSMLYAQLSSMAHDAAKWRAHQRLKDLEGLVAAKSAGLASVVDSSPERGVKYQLPAGGEK